MPDSILDNPLIGYIAVIVIIGIIFSIFLKKRKIGFKEFKPQLFEKTIYDELKKKVDLQGIKIIRGKLLISFHQIARIDRYFAAKGKFALTLFDPKNKEFNVQPKEQDEEFNLLILRGKNPFFLWRLLSIKFHYYILKFTDNDKRIIKFDDKSNRFILPESIDLVSYGNVWTNSTESIEYINDISMKRMNEETMMHLENLPDKLVHLELEQAKLERTGRILTEQEKSKYEERKKASDTSIT